MDRLQTKAYNMIFQPWTSAYLVMSNILEHVVILIANTMQKEN